MCLVPTLFLDFRGLNLRERVQVVEMAISMFASERGSAKPEDNTSRQSTRGRERGEKMASRRISNDKNKGKICV